MSKPSLLPPNATAAEKAIEAAAADRLDIATPLRDLWDPDTCPAELLPWLAWSLSIDAWSPTWPEAVKRSVVKNAIAIQRRKGTAKSVRDVVASFGGTLALREWWQLDPPGTPHTFDIVLNITGADGEPASAAFVQDVIDAVNQTKPARSHFTFTQGVNASGGLGLKAVARPATFARVQSGF